MDGCVMLSDKDEFIYHEMLVHVRSPSTRTSGRSDHRGGDGGILTQLVRYPEIASIDMVEIDAEVVKAAKEFSRSSPRALPTRALPCTSTTVCARAPERQKVRPHHRRLDGSVRTGESLFTKEFYGSCMQRLTADGILVNQHESPYYKAHAREVSLIYSKTSSLFPVVKVYQAHIPTYPSGHWLFGFCSMQYDPVADHDPAAWEARGIPTRYYNSALHKGAFALPNYVLDLFHKAVEDDDF